MSVSKEKFVSHLEKLISSAIRSVSKAHEEPLTGSIARRIASQLWAESFRKAHANTEDWLDHVLGSTGLSPKEVARFMKVPVETVERWINGTEELTSEQCAAIEEIARGALATK